MKKVDIKFGNSIGIRQLETLGPRNVQHFFKCVIFDESMLAVFLEGPLYFFRDA